MNIKKWIALLLALVMVFALAACAKTPESKPTGSEKPTPTTAPSKKPIEKPVYAAPLERHIAMVYEWNFEGLETAMPQEAWDWYRFKHGMDIEDVIAMKETEYSNQLSQLRDEYGHDMTATFEITDDTPIVESELARIAERIAAWCYIDASLITEGHYLEYEVTLSGSEKTGTIKGETFAVVLFDGTWYRVSHDPIPVTGNFSASFDF